jgi:hypothetical protein
MNFTSFSLASGFNRNNQLELIGAEISAGCPDPLLQELIQIIMKTGTRKNLKGFSVSVFLKFPVFSLPFFYLVIGFQMQAVNAKADLT